MCSSCLFDSPNPAWLRLEQGLLPLQDVETVNAAASTPSLLEFQQSRQAPDDPFVQAADLAYAELGGSALRNVAFGQCLGAIIELKRYGPDLEAFCQERYGMSAKY